MEETPRDPSDRPEKRHPSRALMSRLSREAKSLGSRFLLATYMSPRHIWEVMQKDDQPLWTGALALLLHGLLRWHLHRHGRRRP